VSQKVQRNAPCPCGSGKKYKKCCMPKVREQSIHRADQREGIQQALSWINQHYRPQIDQWVEDVWLKNISVIQRQGIATADPQIRTIHDVNLLELLVAEGRFSEIESEATPLQLILNAETVNLDGVQRGYLEQLLHRPLRLYQVMECSPSESFTVEDCFSHESFLIEDKWGSRMFDPGDTVGLRMMETGSGWETSGAIYHIPTEHVDELKKRLQENETNFSIALAEFWLALVAAHV